MTLYEMVEKYGKGKGEAVMWESTKAISEYLEPMAHSNKKEYWVLMRQVFGIINKGHYNEEFAMHDVAEMQPLGEYWSMKQIEEATKGMAFHQDVTLCDKYVAFNAFANDLNGTLADDLILKSAYAFWFADKDWHGEDKIWKYMCLSHKQ
ncbi:MAG: hypothetical protein II260_01115 [Muribaculaceae bacterium]|nr:hypothetical protein [Muribaculaceae bacterium]